MACNNSCPSAANMAFVHFGLIFNKSLALFSTCLLYTSDAADEGLGVDMGGGGVRKKKKNERREEKKKKQPLLIFIASTSLN